MQQIKIEKRISEQVESLRKLAEYLPAGKRNALLNRCAAIASYARKAQAMVDSPVGSLFPATTARYDARTQEDMAAQARAKAAVFAALCAGRKVDLTNAAEFHTSQMHTTITRIRRDIERRNLPYTLCDEWVRPEGTRPFKRYWIIPKSQDNE